MNTNLQTRLDAVLARHAQRETREYDFFDQSFDAAGEPDGFVLLPSRQRLTPDEFFDLVDEKADTAFVALPPITGDEARDAYWDEDTPDVPTTWAAMLAENESAANGDGSSTGTPDDGDGADGAGATPAETERRRLADAYRARCEAWADFEAETARRVEANRQRRGGAAEA